jgi:hypothetical protein
MKLFEATMRHVARLVFAGAVVGATATHAQLLREPARGEAVERHLPGELKLTEWAHDR